MMRHAAAGAHDVVHADAKTRVATVGHRSHQRVEEGHRLDQMWGQLIKRQRALLERLKDQSEVELLEVAETAVEQLAGSAGGAGREVTGFDQAHTEPTCDGIKRATAAGNASADDKNVEVLAGQPVEPRCPRRGPNRRSGGEHSNRQGLTREDRSGSWRPSISRMVPERDRIDSDWVTIRWLSNRTPRSSEPSVTPVAAKNTLSLATR